MRREPGIGIVAIALCVVGCGSSGSSRGNSAVGGGHGLVTANAKIIGSFRIEGGAPPGINRPLSGTIAIHSDSATGPVVTNVTANAGHFRATVAPGAYVAVGTSARQSGVPCTSGPAQSVAPGASIQLAVTCDVP